MSNADAAGNLAARSLRGGGRRVARDLEETNIGGMIESLGRGIAEAQLELDLKSVEIAQLMSGNEVRQPSPLHPEDRSRDRVVQAPRLAFGRNYRDPDDPDVNDTVPAEFSLLELGFTPTFYQFVETILEIKMSVSMSAETEIERHERHTTTRKKTTGFFRRKTTTHVTSVSSRFSAHFQYSVEGSSYVRTKLVPVPPPASLLEILTAAAERARGATSA